MVGLKEAEALSGMTQPTQPMISQPLTNQPMTNQLLTTQPMLSGCRDGGGWHWSQAADGSPLVCLESLLKSM
jgi:hypothetical protein